MKFPSKLARPIIALISICFCFFGKRFNNSKSLGYPLYMYTGRRDFWMCLLSLRFFLAKTKTQFCVYLIDDGSLTILHQSLFRLVYPFAVFISKIQSDHLVTSKLVNYPHLFDLYNNFILMPKLLVPNLYPTYHESFLFLDSDVLTFSSPAFIDSILKLKSSSPQSNRISYFNKDIASSYIYDADYLQDNFNLSLYSLINSGLFIFEKASFNLDLLERIISDPNFSDYFRTRPWVTEQTLYAILASNSQNAFEFLPHEYDVNLTKLPKSNPMIHYVGAIRSKYLTQGLFHKFFVSR